MAVKLNYLNYIAIFETIWLCVSKWALACLKTVTYTLFVCQSYIELDLALKGWYAINLNLPTSRLHVIVFKLESMMSLMNNFKYSIDVNISKIYFTIYYQLKNIALTVVT